VSYEEGMNLANELGIDFIEVSVKDFKILNNIDDIFHNLTRKYFHSQKKENLNYQKKKIKKGLFSSLSNDDDVEIKLSKN
jgi:L-ribulose-5-phosphate 3-epimerase UlaE